MSKMECDKDEGEGVRETERQENLAVLVLPKAKLHPFDYHMSLLIKPPFYYIFEVSFYYLQPGTNHNAHTQSIYEITPAHCKDHSGVGPLEMNTKTPWNNGLVWSTVGYS